MQNTSLSPDNELHIIIGQLHNSCATPSELGILCYVKYLYLFKIFKIRDFPMFQCFEYNLCYLYLRSAFIQI